MTVAPAIESTVIDPIEFRKALGCYPTGVTVVTTRDASGVARGFTANSFTSVSLTPPLVLVCLAKAAHSHAVFTTTERFAINVLAEDQKGVASLFASKQPDKFQRCAWHAGATGTPVIDGAVATFECRTYQCVAAGDHTILIGEVLALQQGPARPLGYCRGAYVGYQDEQAMATAAQPQARVAALVETARGVVMLQDGNGHYSLPGAPRLGRPGSDDGLQHTLLALGLKATLDFIFSVYEDRQGPCVVYRGRAPEPAPHQLGVSCVPLQDLAHIPLSDEAHRSMLMRYARERQEDVFGVYVGDAEQGDVCALMPSI